MEPSEDFGDAYMESVDELRNVEYPMLKSM